MLASTKVEFADNGKLKTVTIAGRKDKPAIIDLTIDEKNTAEPNRSIALTSSEAGAVVDAIREHLKGILREKGVKA